MTGLIRKAQENLGLTTTGAVVVAAAVGGWVVAHQLRSREALLLVYGMLIAVVLAWVVQRRPLRVEGRRAAVPARMRAGQRGDVEIDLIAQQGVVGAAVTEDRGSELGGPVRLAIAELSPSAPVQMRYSMTAHRRGVHVIGPLTVTRDDAFGLVTRRKVIAGIQTVIVHPRVEAVRDRVVSRAGQDPPIRPPASRPSPSGFDFSGMRAYVPGDDLRRIVWRASARATQGATDEPHYMVRESERGVTDHVRLVVDTDGAHHSPGDPSETFENAVRVVASLGVRHLGEGSSVNLEANARPLLVGLRGGRDRIRFLDELAGIDRERVPLTAALQRLARARGTVDVHTVVVTAHVDVDAAARLRMLSDRGLAVLVVHVAWADADPASRHRALATGCRVVEIGGDQALESAFGRVVGAGVGRPR